MNAQTGAINIALILAGFLSSRVSMAHKGEDHGDKKSLSKPEINIKAEAVVSISDAYLKDIKPIFKKSCYDCHSSYSQYPWYFKIPGAKQLIESDIKEAQSHLDFSQDYPFKSHGTPREDLEAIKASVENDDMPPFRYLILHPSAHLNKQNKEKIAKWIDESLKILNE